MPTYKDINLLTQKSAVAGTEKLPVSDTEFITPDQIVADVALEIGEFSFNQSFAQGSYPTTATSIGFGARSGQKLIVNASTTGSLGYGWFITGKKADGTSTTLSERYGAVTDFEITIAEDYEDILLRIAASNSGTQTISIALVNWKTYVDGEMRQIEAIAPYAYDVADQAFAGTYAQGSYPTTAVSMGFGLKKGQTLTCTVTSTGSLGYGWFITGKRADGTTVTLAERYAAVTDFNIAITEDYEDVLFRMASGNSGTATVDIAVRNWRYYVDNSIGDIETILASI